MPYMMIEDFSGGLDLRKSAETAKPGTLRSLKNAYVTAGGEIMKRYTLTSYGSAPAGTHGVAFKDNKLVVFGTAASMAGLPPSTVYQQLDTAKTIDRILDAHPFGSKLYTVARMTDGSIEHFLDATKTTAKGTNIRPHKRKMYSIDSRNLWFSAVNDAADWSGTGSGGIDVSTEDSGSPDLVGIEAYYGHLALFGRNSVQVWAMDPDPALNTQQQVLGNVGLVAPNAVARYGNGDVLFLSHTGIRSLRARDSSNAAILNDIGSPVDPMVYDLRAVLNDATVDRITALVDPLSGHFWLVWGKRVLILSYYPNSKVSAWSVYEFPVTPDYVTLAGSRIVFRAGNELFVYGTLPVSGSVFDPNSPLGTDPAMFDSTPVEIITPMIDLQQPATQKDWNGIDVACEGTWDVFVNPDHLQPAVWQKVGTVNGSSFNHGSIPLGMSGTHMQVKLVSVGAGKHSLASIGLHFEGGEDS